MLTIKIDYDRYGHITRETHERAEAIATQNGVPIGLQFSPGDGRTLEVWWIEAHWSGRPRACVLDMSTKRKGWWFVERIVDTLVRVPQTQPSRESVAPGACA